MTRGSTYHMVIRENGTRTKIINMHLSETVNPSNRTAKRDKMGKIEERLREAEQKIKVQMG